MPPVTKAFAVPVFHRGIAHLLCESSNWMGDDDAIFTVSVFIQPVVILYHYSVLPRSKVTHRRVCRVTGTPGILVRSRCRQLTTTEAVPLSSPQKSVLPFYGQN